MRAPIASLAALLLLSPAAPAREDLPPPVGGPPEFCLASASRDGGVVVIRVSRLAPIARETVNGQEVFVLRNHWVAPREMRLGEQVRAYRPDGKEIGAEDLLKALAKPVGVACFIGTVGIKPAEPDPFYLGLLREGGVVLAFELPPEPPGVAGP